VSFLNLSIVRTAYTDELPSSSPVESLFDHRFTRSGIPVDDPSGGSHTINPGQTVSLGTTARPLTYSATTEFNTSFPVTGSPLVRMRWTGVGTEPGFRAYRDIGGNASTAVDLIRVSPTALKIQNSSGTALDFSTVEAGDEVHFHANEEAFSNPMPYGMCGQTFQVIESAANFFVIRDNGTGSPISSLTLGSALHDAMRIFSSSGVQIGDKISFSPSSVFSYDNKAYIQTITSVTDREVMFINPYALPETTVPGAGSISIFLKTIGFLAVQASGPIELLLDGSTDHPIRLSQLGQGDCVFLGSIKANSVSARNSTNETVHVLVHTCSI
jgi:hypothetical protein